MLLLASCFKSDQALYVRLALDISLIFIGSLILYIANKMAVFEYNRDIIKECKEIATPKK